MQTVRYIIPVTPLPDAFQTRMRALLPGEADALLAALSEPPQRGLRLNTLKLSAEQWRSLSPWPLASIPWTNVGFHLPEDSGAGKHPYHAAGLYYLQEPSAMAVAEAVAPRPGELILDLAAAPGGKATALAALSRGEGLVVANEVHRGRAKVLGENLERFGAKNVVMTGSEVRQLAERWGAVFGSVLLDAPCSGEGMFRKSADALSMWSEGTVQACAHRQQTLITEAARLVKPGGNLIYSTCTFAPEENEEVIAGFLMSQPDFVLEPLSLPSTSPGRPDWAEPSGHDLGGAVRLWPHRVRGEGHFVARLRRTSGAAGRVRSASFRPLPADVRKLWTAFARDLLPRNPFETAELTLFGDRLFALPERVPDIRGVNVLRTGVGLARVRKSRLEPLHALALTLTRAETQEMNRLELPSTDERLPAYLQGHVIEAPGPKGWTLITVDGYGVGWGKRSGSAVTNHYPKGLRWLR